MKPNEQTCVESHAHVGHELFGEPDVHKLDDERLNAHETIGDEVARVRCQHYGKQLIFQTKSGNGSNRHYSE